MAYTTIDDPSAHFQTKLWTGNGSTQSITNDGNSDLQPDLIWAKERNTTGFHGLWDSSRGTNKSLSSNSTAAEQANTGTGVTSYNADGFTGVTGSYSEFNRSSQPYVTWQWKANAGSTSSNTDGGLTSTVQANTDAGFSIVTYSGDGATTQTIGHGLGQRPDVVMIKRRNSTGSFIVWTSSLTSGAFLQLAATNAEFVQSRIYQAGMTTTTFGVGFNNTTNASGNTYLAYCFASKQGFSKFGKYTGNGSSDGPFVYTGFKPAWVMIKSSSSSTDGNWYILDNKRDTYNVTKKTLEANTMNAEVTPYDRLDFLSNGFKNRVPGSNGWNVSGQTYIYMAFAENPFVTSTGIPTTAR